MVSIEGLHLDIVEEHGRRTAVVTYRLLGGPQNGDHERHTEKVELLGDDNRPGEDGIDDFIAQKFELVLLPLSDPRRRHTFVLSAAQLDEDRGANPNVIDLFEDEIVARVTIGPTPKQWVAKSNVVQRGGPPKKVFETLPG